MVRLEPLHLDTIALGRSAAVRLGMADALQAARSGHELWTAALLVHEVGLGPAWRVGCARPAATVATVLVAARRLADAAREAVGGASES